MFIVTMAQMVWLSLAQVSDLGSAPQTQKHVDAASPSLAGRCCGAGKRQSDGAKNGHRR